MVRVMVWLAVAVGLGLVTLAAYVRLAPHDPGLWHVPVAAEGAPGQVAAGTGRATLFLPAQDAAPAELLARLDAVAQATPRTTRLAGSVDEGRITWVTRSLVFGFPDYTTAETRPDGVAVVARLRFGRDDMGVNAARLRDWQGRLSSP